MAKKTLASTVKRNAITAAKRTAAKAVKEAARTPLVALLSASDNPALQAAARALEGPHGDAALQVLVGVVGMLALPEKITGNEHVAALLDELQVGGFEHFTSTAYEHLAQPFTEAVGGALMAYASKMAALEGAKAALGPGTEE